MEESDKPSEAAPRATARKTPSRRKTAPKAKGTATRRSSTTKKIAGRRRRAKSSGPASVWKEWSARAGAAGGSLAAVSEEGLEKARRALDSVGSASRNTIARLLAQWNRMDSRKRAQFLAALVGALAAASAPIVRRRIKK